MLSLLEQLESRRLLTATMLGSVVIVTGTQSSENYGYATYSIGTYIYDLGNQVTDGPFIGATSIEVDMGDGNDTFSAFNFGSDLPMWVRGGAGHDTLSSGGGNDTIEGGDGNDSIIGNGGNDSIVGENGDDIIGGEDGNDTIYGDNDNDALYGGSGSDVVVGGFGNDFLDGQAGDGDSVYGEWGDDTLEGDSGAFDHLDGGFDTDVVNYGARSADLTLKLNTGFLDSGEANENDMLSGIDGAIGGSGADDINASTVPDPVTLTGGAGNDTLTGGLNDDLLYGDQDDDIFDGGLGADTLDGGTGTDTVTYASRTSHVTIDMGAGSNSGETGEHDVVTNSIDVAIGGSGDDYIGGFSTFGSVTLIGNAGDDYIFGGSYDDLLDGGPGADAMFSTGGTDTIDYSGRTASITATINSGVNDDGELNENDSIGTGRWIIKGGSSDDVMSAAAANSATTLIGNGGDDSLVGSGNDDELDGGAGDDTLDGGLGVDVLDGGADHDVVSYANRQSDVTVYLGLTHNPSGENGGNEGDTIADSVEEAIGGSGNDTLDASAAIVDVSLSGGAGNDSLVGGTGDDEFDGGSGGDTFVGGLGFDLASYKGHSVDIDVSIGTGNSDDGAAGEHDDVTMDIDYVVGGSGNDRLDASAVTHDVKLAGNSGNDTLIGSAFDDGLAGGNGDDYLDGGLGGDRIDGGHGDDTLDYSSRTHSVLVTLRAGQSDDGEAGEGDNVVSNIAVVIGGSAADTLQAGSSERGVTLYGQGGNDTLLGSPFNDRLVGGTGSDSLNGRAGDDVLVMSGSGRDTAIGGTGNDWVDYQAARKAVYVALDGTARSGVRGEGTTINADVENVQGSRFSDTIVGNASINILNGGSGDDSIYGFRRNDALYGGPGADFLDGGAGVNTLDGGSGIDRAAADVNNILVSVP